MSDIAIKEDSANPADDIYIRDHDITNEELHDGYARWILERRQRDHTLRCVTIRTNDGTNQCQPPDVWTTIAKRIALAI